MTEEEFEQKIRQDCGYCGVALEVTKERSLTDSDGVSNGYFDGDKLAYAKGHDKWFPVALHEYNHMCQWAEGDPIWHNTTQVDADEYFWTWLDGSRRMGQGLIKKYAMCYLQLELDCERRAQKMIKDLDLPLDPARYAQTANAYIMFYHMIVKYSKWYEIGKEPYHIEEIVSAMPEDLYTLNYEEISDEMVTLFETHMPYLLPDWLRKRRERERSESTGS